MTDGHRSKYGNCRLINKRQIEKRAGAGAELAELSELAGATLQNSKAANTKRAYRSDLNSFVSFCAERNLSALPAAPQTIVLFLTWLDSVQNRAPATIERRLVSLRLAHTAAGFESPINAAVREQMKAIKRTRGTAQTKARPLTALHLKKIVLSMKPDVLDTRDKAILLLGFAGALRRSEISALNFTDLEFVDAGLILNIRRSKTDQAGAGARIAIPKTGNALCAVAAVQRWVALSAIHNGALFRRVGRYGANVFFANVYERRLSGRAICELVKKHAGRIGLPARHYSGHSLRAGWSTEAARIGLAMPLMMAHTRHKSADIAAGYVREANIFEINPLAMLFA